jgi:hypothetical protein
VLFPALELPFTIIKLPNAMIHPIGCLCCDRYEERVRGLDAELLAEFEPEESVTNDALGFS